MSRKANGKNPLLNLKSAFSEHKIFYKNSKTGSQLGEALLEKENTVKNCGQNLKKMLLNFKICCFGQMQSNF
jgi:hypothetical protein